MLTKTAPLKLPIANGNFVNNEVVLDTPVVLAPMAGITNSAFRTLCREQGAGLFVSEMVTARALIERHPETLRLITPGKGETPRSVQLYAVDPKVTQLAVKMLVEENLADHIDMNFGCPVPKVTRRGGGSALPFKQTLFYNIVKSAVDAAKPYGVPVTIKMRIGIDEEHETYFTAAKAAADVGVSWVALHARFASQLYEGNADWSAIAKLVEFMDGTGVPVLGNGDIWSGADGVRMMNETGCAGVVVGRGCLGRPWLFRDLVSAFNGDNTKVEPTLFEVREIMRRHATLLMEFFEQEGRAMRDLRKHMAWYLKGFTVNRELRSRFGMVASFGELEHLLAKLEDQPYPSAVAEGPRGRKSHGRPVHLPENWLADPFEIPAITIDDSVSGG
jgi:nifR3 family TIM-barrel protein